MSRPFCGPQVCSWVCKPPEPPPVDCLISADDFERTTVGPDWDITTGSWSIVSGRLRSIGTGIATYLVDQPEGKTEYAVGTRAIISGTDATVYVRLGDDLYFALIWKQGGACATLEINQGGTVLESLNATAAADVQFIVGYTAEREVAWLGLYSADLQNVYACIHAEAVTGVTGLQVHLGTDDNQAGVDFEFIRFDYPKTVARPNCTGECPKSGSPDDCGFTSLGVRVNADPITDDDLLCRWRIISGQWAGQVIGGRMTTTDSNALVESLELEEGVPAYGYHHMSCNVTVGGEGDQARLYIDYDGAADCYMCEITAGAPNPWGDDFATVELYRGNTLISKPNTTFPLNHGSSTGINLYISQANDGVDVLSHRPLIGQPTRALAAIERKGNRRVAFGTGTVVNSVSFQGIGAGSQVDKDNGTQCAMRDPGQVCASVPGFAGAVRTLQTTISGLIGNSHMSGCDMSTLNGTYVPPDEAGINKQCNGQILGFVYCSGFVDWNFGLNVFMVDGNDATYGYGANGYVGVLNLFESNYPTTPQQGYNFYFRTPLVPKSEFLNPATWLNVFDRSDWSFIRYLENNIEQPPPSSPLMTASYRVQAIPSP